jgi:peroxiredoxin
MVIYRRFLLFLCLVSVSFAQHTPRLVADVPIRTTDRKIIKMSQYRGKVVLLVMMLTTCDECLGTMQFMARLQNEMGSRGLQVVAISLDENAVVPVAYAERYRFPFPMGHLDKDPAVKLLDLNATAHPVVPTMLFVDWQGKVRFQYAGNDPVFNQGEKGIRTIADGLVREAAEKKGPTYKTVPAGK